MKVREYGGSSQAKDVGSVIGEYLGELGLAAGLNEHKIRTAWDEVSGAGRWTLDRSFMDGTLYVRLSSSMVRSRLFSKLETIRKGINASVTADPLFTRTSNEDEPVKKIVLQ